jgi:signal transduction histidine kinase
MQTLVGSVLAQYYFLTILLILGVTVIGHFLVPFFDLVSIALFYLLPVLISAVRWGRGPSFFACLLSVSAFDYFFVPPAFGFRPNDPRDLTVLAVFLIVAVVTGTMATRLRNEREHLRALASHLQSIREEERSIIAREIHDELGQALTGLKIDVLRLSKKLTKEQEGLIEEIHSMGKLIDDVIQTIRKISTELRPGILDDLGLVSAIEWQVEDFKNRAQIQAEFSSTLEDRNLERDLSTALFRILQETLTNIIRHAQATHVKVNIRKDADVVILTVEDNGRGITERETFDAKSLGLLGIRERVLIYGGEVQINGHKGKGTKVVVKIPFREADKQHA